MIFRLTLNLAKKIGIASLPFIPNNDNMNHILDWNVNLFTLQFT